MGRNFTLEQLDAINSSGENIIVSAGAGSGKTAVLTERVITKLRNGISINELLVLTFSNAAAKEMKERIRGAIKQEDSLADMLDYIDSSYITTFDSFSLSVVKKYHYLLGISKNIGIIEPSIINLIKKDILDNIMEIEYSKKEEDFTKLISDFCLKDDNNITNAIIKMYSKIGLIYNFTDYLNSYIENNYSDSKLNQDVLDYTNFIIRKIGSIETMTGDLYNELDSDHYNKLVELLTPLINSTTYLDIKMVSTNIKYPPIKRGSSDIAKKLNTNIATLVKEIKALVSYEDVDEILETIIATKPYVSAFIRIILKLDQEIMAYKKERNLYEFNDIACMAITLVRDYKVVKDELCSQFKEILLDEYQDTSDLQELFISSISNNNVYMVGDIKQSIYRFRNANPDIFRNKYNDYKVNNGGKKIDLNRNFRSRNTVLDNINRVFNLIMDDNIGGANYSAEHQLMFGNKSYTEIGNTDQNMNMEIINYSLEKDYPFSKEEVEAFIVGNDIKKKVTDKYQIFDKDQSILRDIKYSDFAILINRTKNFDLYKKIFTYLEIPMAINMDQKLTDALIIKVMNNIFKLLVSKKHDTNFNHAYASVARSFLFEITDEIIFECITNNDFSNDQVMNKINNIKGLINNSTNNQMLDYIIKEFDIYERLILIGDIEENLVRMDYLAVLANNMTDIGYDFYKVSEYIDSIFSSDLEIKYTSKSETKDAVKIMTIHKSKGLEFYICYYPELNNDFMLDDLKDKFTYYSSFGFVMPYYNNGIRRTIFTDLLKETYIKDSISEQLRLFYVALTRAKEKMIMIGNISDNSTDNNLSLVPSMIRNNYRSFADILSSVSGVTKEYISLVDINNLFITKDYQINSKELDLVLNDKYPVEVINIEFKNEEIEEKVFSHKINNLKSYEEEMLMKAGNYFHEVLEVIDLKHPNFSDLDIEEIHKDQIKIFLSQDILDDINDASVYQEYEFMDTTNHRHGIIDLMLEYDDKIKIIDYKLQNIDNANYIEQLNGYKEYIENKTGKPVKIYLYSIINGVYKEI